MYGVHWNGWGFWPTASNSLAGGQASKLFGSTKNGSKEKDWRISSGDEPEKFEWQAVQLSGKQVKLTRLSLQIKTHNKLYMRSCLFYWITVLYILF